MKKKTLAALALVLVAAAFALAPVALAGCSPAATPEEARDAYAAQQAKCIEEGAKSDAGSRAEMRAQIDLCRARVKEAWGRNPVKDAGAEGGAL